MIQSVAGELVQAKLKKRGWSQADLQREMNARGGKVPSGIICRWIAGKLTPSIERMVMIDEILGVAPKLWAVPTKEHAA